MLDNVGLLKIYSTKKVAKYDNANRKDVVCYRIASIDNLYHKVIPIFEEYSLLSKKQKDFLIWKKIVTLLYKTKHKKNSRNKIKNKLINLVNELHEIKKYNKKKGIK